jgi:chromosome segregation ATPase
LEKYEIEVRVRKEVEEKIIIDTELYKEQERKTKELTTKYKALNEELKEEIKQKKAIMAEYDKRFEEMEEEVQTVAGEAQSSRMSTNTKIMELQREIELLHKGEEELALAKQKEKNAIIQERVEHKKTIKILEKNIEVLTGDKTRLEQRLVELKTKTGGRLAMMIDKGVQSILEESDKPSAKHNEFSNLKSYSDSLKSEIGQMSDRLSVVNEKLEETVHTLEGKEAELQKFKVENERLIIENKDLKVRRVKAMAEISKLNKLFAKHQDDFLQSKGRSHSKRYSSEAVH